jgi:hypothetical protein
MVDPAAENNQGSAIPPPSSTPTAEKQAEEHHGASGNDDQPPPQSAWARWQKHSLPELVMAYFTGVVAICAALQIWILIGGSGQTDQLIKAANINASAAQKSAKAAQDFAIAAQNINLGVGDAVDKLNLQAGATKTIATTAGKQADAARLLADTALKNLDAEKALDRASISVQHPEIVEERQGGRAYLRVSLINSGRTSASNVKYFFTQERVLASHMADRPPFRKHVRDTISKFPPLHDDVWIDLPDVPANNSPVPIDFIFSGDRDIDYYNLWIAKVAYMTVFGESVSEEFCVYARVDYGTSIPRVFSYTPQWCPVGQSRDSIGLIPAEGKKGTTVPVLPG